MTEFDFSAIKLLAPLLEIRNSTYLSIANFTVFDLYGKGISDYEAKLCHTLLSFNLDLNEGLLGLIFKDEVDKISSNLTLITIQNSENSGGIHIYQVGYNRTQLIPYKLL